MDRRGTVRGGRGWEGAPGGGGNGEERVQLGVSSR